MEFRTKIDYSSNRQITQREKTSTLFSGSTTFGLPFSGLTSGVDFDSLIILDDLLLEGVFTGTTGTTTFTWSDNRASLGDIALSPITPLNSGETQSTGQVFVVLDSTIIDGYTVNLSYTGVSLSDISVNTMIELSPGIYSGSVDVDIFQVLSASTLDFKGRTIWIDNPEITRTRKLIVSDGAINGYVLTSNSEGMGYWAPTTGATQSPFIYNPFLPSPNTSIVPDFSNNAITSGSTYSSILGGLFNNINGFNLSIVGGYANNNTGYSNFMGNGSFNTNSGNYSSIVGGTNNINSGIKGFIGGGINNINSGTYSGSYSSIVGGYFNTNSGSTSSIVGGDRNTNSGFASFIGGGYRNTNSGTQSSIVGGKRNTNSGNYSSIVGGQDNTNSGNYSSIVGGENNVSNGNNIHIIGSNISATTANTTYVEGLNIKNLSAGVLNVNIGLDSNGFVVSGLTPTTINPFIDLGNVTGFTWDVSGNSSNYEVTLTGNTTMDLINVRNGEFGTIIIKQDGVGNNLLTFGTVNGSATTHRVVNGGGGTPTLTANANAIDILSFTWNGGTMFWTVGNDYT